MALNYEAALLVGDRLYHAVSLCSQQGMIPRNHFYKMSFSLRDPKSAGYVGAATKTNRHVGQLRSKESSVRVVFCNFATKVLRPFSIKFRCKVVNKLDSQNSFLVVWKETAIYKCISKMLEIVTFSLYVLERDISLLRSFIFIVYFASYECIL